MSLCQSCGLCCDGTFFSQGSLEPGEAERAVRIGLPLVSRKREPTFPQPCAQHRGNACAIYDDRPACCRNFRCRLLRDVEVTNVTEERALAHIARARELSASIRAAAPAVHADESIYAACQSLTSAPAAIDWRREHAEILLDVAELIHISRKHFGIRDGDVME